MTTQQGTYGVCAEEVTSANKKKSSADGVKFGRTHNVQMVQTRSSHTMAHPVVNKIGKSVPHNVNAKFPKAFFTVY
jgi:hypothetical protein